MELEDIHDCPKSHGKIVCITANSFGGDTRCAYCNQRVNYKQFEEEEMKKLKEKR